MSQLMAARDGSIWVGYSLGDVAVYRDGALRETGLDPGNFVHGFAQTSDGAIWAALGALERQLSRYHRGRWENIGENWGLPQEHMIDLLAARDGTLWVTTLQSILVFKKGARRFEKLSVPFEGHAALSQDAAGRIWLSDLRGSRAIANSPSSSVAAPRFLYPTPGFPRSVHTFFDRDGSLWGRTTQDGLFRVRFPEESGAVLRTAAVAQVETIRVPDGLLTDTAPALLEDREGNIWIGSAFGLERFRAANVVAEPMLKRDAIWGFSLMSATDGTVYVGQKDSVYRILAGGRPEPLLQNVSETDAICEAPDKTVWIVLRDRIVRLSRGRMQHIARPPITGGGIGIVACAVDRQGSLWLGAGEEGLWWRDQQGWHQHRLGRASLVKNILVDRDGSLLAYDGDSALFHIVDSAHPISQIDLGAQIERLYTMYRGPRDVLAGGVFGFARFQAGKAQLLPPGRFPTLAGTAGIVQTPAGETWLIGRAGIVRLSTAALERTLGNARLPLRTEVMDLRDGLPGGSTRYGQHGAVRGGDGRLWFDTSGGVVWVDPARLVRNRLPPPVRVGALRAHGKTWLDPLNVTLPAGTSSGEIDFAVPSLSIPERVQVRYRLEGMETQWTDPGLRRQMFFSNLGPGTYRFRVIAANNDGVWNRAGATLIFTIPPTFLQSKWFQLICILAGLTVLWLVYTLRVQRVRMQVQAGMEVRLAERERIARELHDTLLQGFHGLVLHFHAAASQIPVGRPARKSIDDALLRADVVLAQSRDRVYELRTSAGSENLSEAWMAAAADFGLGSTISFDVTVEGTPRVLHPLVHEELQRIGEEAIRNAYRHSAASSIGVLLSYNRRNLRLLIRDNGSGLPADVVAAGGRPGHFGLAGMRERARRIGGTLKIVSRPGGGTELLLSIPGRAAYAEQNRRWKVPSFLAAKRERE